MTHPAPATPQPKPKRPGEDIFGLVVLLGSLFLLWKAYQISGFSALSSPGAFPMAVAAVMSASAAWVVFDNIRRNRAGVGIDRTPLLSLTGMAFLGLIGLYGFALETLGFLVSSFIFLVAGMMLLKAGKPLKIVGIVTLSLAIIYVLFRLIFQVVLPEGIVPEGQILAAISNMVSGGQ